MCTGAPVPAPARAYDAVYVTKIELDMNKLRLGWWMDLSASIFVSVAGFVFISS